MFKVDDVVAPIPAGVYGKSYMKYAPFRITQIHGGVMVCQSASVAGLPFYVTGMQLAERRKPTLEPKHEV